MRIIYECSHCGKQFNNISECMVHEITESHMENDPYVKEYIVRNEEDVCKFCDNAYYVYGCELDCQYKECNSTNYYKDFKRSEPL